MTGDHQDTEQEAPLASEFTPPPVATISDKEVATVARGLLEETQAPLLLADLGSRLSKHYSKALREILGSRKLKKVLETQLRGEIAFEGELSQVAAKLLTPADKINVGRYHPTVWAAFHKPLVAPNTARGLKTSPPFDFMDFSLAADIPSGWRSVNPVLIPDTTLRRQERERATKMAIHDWSAREGLDPEEFVLQAGATPEKAPQSAALTVEPKPTVEPGSKIDALRRFIDAIPEDRRGEHTLTLDLVRQFLI